MSSHKFPTITLSVITAPVDAPWHGWPALACGGMSIGHKGMIYASKALAATMIDLYRNPKTISEIRGEFDEDVKNSQFSPTSPPDRLSFPRQSSELFRNAALRFDTFPPACICSALPNGR